MCSKTNSDDIFLAKYSFKSAAFGGERDFKLLLAPNHKMKIEKTPITQSSNLNLLSWQSIFKAKIGTDTAEYNFATNANVYFRFWATVKIYNAVFTLIHILFFCFTPKYQVIVNE